MTQNGNRCAFAHSDHEYGASGLGLTKREYIAIAMMQSLVQRGDTPKLDSARTYAKNALKYADALLEELEDPSYTD